MWNVWKKLMLPILFVLVSSSCKDCQPDVLNPAGPSDPTGSSDVRHVWSPYINIHSYGAGESQKPYLEQMIRAGALRGARVGNLGASDVQRFPPWLSDRGVEVLGLFDNEHLRKPDVNEIFSGYVRQNPSVRVWEIGNEVEGIPPVGTRMSPQEYMPIFKSLFYYAKAHHPEVRLAPQSDGLGEMLDAGLDQIIRDGLQIVTVHFYEQKTLHATQSLEEAQQQVARVPGTVQIWITETGDNDWLTQVLSVETNYPRYRRTLRAIRIFWYVMSECPENGGDFSLIKGLPDKCATTPTPSPLFTALTGGGQ